MNADIELDPVNIRAVRTTALVPVFALALFTSAALLFWGQPLVAKMLVPLLGGSPSVWNTCIVFFQALLLAGYAYTLLISQHLSVKNQAIVHEPCTLVFAQPGKSHTLAPYHVVRYCWAAVFAAFSDGPTASEVVLIYESQSSARSLFPLLDQ
jgi:hypothetical protein